MPGSVPDLRDYLPTSWHKLDLNGVNNCKSFRTCLECDSASGPTPMSSLLWFSTATFSGKMRDIRDTKAASLGTLEP
jgi:hypothetical protein